MNSKLWQPGLAFAVCVLLGVCMRNHQLARANRPDCYAGIGADFREVRRIEGTGDISTQEASWRDRLTFDISSKVIVLESIGAPSEEFVLDEDAP